MTAVVKSQLNPLASSFVPANCKDILLSKKAIVKSFEIENEVKTTREGRGKRKSNDLEYLFAVLKINRIHDVSSSFTSLNVFLKKSNMDQTDYKKLDTQLVKLEERFAVDGKELQNYVADESMLPKTSDDTKLVQNCIEDVSVVPETTNADQQLVQKPNASVSMLCETIVEENECTCPPMFGWILPPDFIGNPFNFKYDCCKKYPHSPNSVKKFEYDTDELDLDAQVNKWTLDRCCSEFKDIITDVYETISMDPDPIAKWDEKYKIQDYLEVSDSESDEGSVLDSAYRTATEPELIDDGVHPLLQSVPNAEEDEQYSVEQVEKILEKSLSPVPQGLDAFTFQPGVVCDPPCSVWCEFLPPSVKDTFKKCVQNSGKTKCNETGYKQSSFGHRPVFKRSLSADDALMYGQIKGLNETSESREMLLLRRKDPLSYFRNRSSTREKKYGSCDLTDLQLFASSEKSSMWGKFDGADSLWQPLPECIPVKTQNLKSNLKRGREQKLPRMS